MSRLVRLVFSDEGESYSKLIEGGDPRAVLTQLVQIISDPAITACLVNEASSLPPEQRMILMQVMEQAKAISEGYVEEQIQKNPQLAEKIQANMPANGGEEMDNNNEQPKSTAA